MEIEAADAVAVETMETEMVDPVLEEAAEEEEAAEAAEDNEKQRGGNERRVFSFVTLKKQEMA